MIALSSINKAVVFPFNLPAVAELGTASGFDMELLDNGNLGTKTDPGAKRAIITGSAITESSHRGTSERTGRYADVQSERQRRES